MSNNNTTTILTTITTTIATAVLNNSTVFTTTTTTGSTSILTETISMTSTTQNQSIIADSCLLKYSSSTCRLGEFIRVLAYLLLAVSLLPQILHLFNHGSRYIAGISYMWMIIR